MPDVDSPIEKVLLIETTAEDGSMLEVHMVPVVRLGTRFVEVRRGGNSLKLSLSTGKGKCDERFYRLSLPDWERLRENALRV